MMTKFNLTVVLFVTLYGMASAQKEFYEPNPKKERRADLRDKDYTNLPFTQKLGSDHSEFTVHDLNFDTYEEEWKGIDRTFIKENAVMISMKGEEDVIFSEYVYNVVEGKTKAMVGYYCMNKKERPVQVDMDVFDSNHYILYKKKASSNQLKIQFKSETEAFLRFRNPSKRRVNCFIEIDCIECGRYKQGPMDKEYFDEKLDRVNQLGQYIDEIRQHNNRAVINTFLFVDRVYMAEMRLYIFSGVEFFALFLMTVWQVRRVKNMFDRTSGII